MMRLTVKEKLENGKYLVNYNLDGEDLGDREQTYEWIRADIVTNNKEVKYIFDIEMEFDYVQVDEEDGEGFIYLVKVEIDEENNMSQYDVETKVYKSYKRAMTQATKLAQQLDTILVVL